MGKGIDPIPCPECLPCPWCGLTPQIEPWHGGGPLKMMVSCPDGDSSCDVGPMVTGPTRRKAIKIWNTRKA